MKKKIFTFFAVTFFVFLLIMYIFLFSGKFNVKNITILGQTNFTKDKILKLANIDTSKNIYMIDISEIKKNIENDNYVESVEVNRKFPQEITISIIEKIPVASIPVTGGYVIIDSNATAINIVQDEAKIQKPLIKGISIKNVKLKDTIPVKDKEQLENILEIIKQVYSLDLLENISYIDLSKLKDVSMTTKTGIIVKFGNLKNMEYKTKLLNKILIKLSTSGKTSGTLDMRYDTDPVYYE